jgi:hypothetical protein
MPFEKNHSLSTGRPIGSGNKDVSQIREAFQYLIENNLERLQKDLESLDAKDRCKMILGLSSYVLPKLKQIESINENETIYIDFTQ